MLYFSVYTQNGGIMNNIVIVAKIVANEGKSDLVKSELNKLLAPTHAEEGNVSYKIHQDMQNPNKFVAVEEWANGEAIQAHMATEHIKAYTQVTTENAAIASFEYVTLSEI